MEALERPQSAPIQSSASSETSRPAAPHEHAHHRFFIGPLPDKVVTKEQEFLESSRRHRLGLHRTGTLEAESDEVSQMIREHAFDFFVRRGGDPENWGEDEERHVVREMLHNWRESEWGQVFSKKKDAKQSRWVGTSFEIGAIMGLNVLDNIAQATSGISSAGSRRGISQTFLPLVFSNEDAGVRPTLHGRVASVDSSGGETFLTAPPELPQQERPVMTLEPAPKAASLNGAADVTDHPAPTSDEPPSGSVGSSQVPLLLASTSGQPVPPRPIIRVPSLAHSDLTHVKGPQRKKVVHYLDQPISYSPMGTSISSTDSPADPAEVLEREGSDVEATSAGAMSSFSAPDLPTASGWNDVLMRDRMYVRVCYARFGNIAAPFDEAKHRTAQHLEHEDWSEFMVVWRQDRIELYDDYTISAKEWITGHKHLSYVIPTNSEHTKFSLYSFADLTFCLTCTPTSTTAAGKAYRKLRREKEGVNIFIFKLRSRSLAYDWMWKLWQLFDGTLPNTIDVWNPSLETKVKIDVPSIGIEKAYTIFNRENVLGLVMQSLRSVPEFKTLIEGQVASGSVLELAWRMDTHLDWIWLEEDIFGMSRDWIVLCGLAAKQASRPVQLEIRLAQHLPQYLLMRNNERLEEPHSIEGYLHRIKPNTQNKQLVYLATHNGFIFTCPPSHANAPSPIAGSHTSELSEAGETLRKAEFRRGVSQIMHATGVSDLRSIVAIRRAFQAIVPSKHEEREPDDGSWAQVWSEAEQPTESDDEDEGGDEALSKAGDKGRLKMRRSFELLLKNGHIVRFEAHSRRFAMEWIEKLKPLVHYWKQRHRIDAREEMDLAQSRRPRVTPNTHVHPNEEDMVPEAPADPSAPLPALGTLFNWCVLENCMPIVRGGRVYMRRGYRGQYQLKQVFIVAGHMVHFKIRPNNSLYTATKRKISLADAYVVSGYFAALTLPSGQYNPCATPTARRYQDGLECDDPEEDLMFMIIHQRNTGAEEELPVGAVPALSSKKKVAIFRTRSKLERDAWCWAINCEIERVVRSQPEHEEKLRAAGKLVDQ